MATGEQIAVRCEQDTCVTDIYRGACATFAVLTALPAQDLVTVERNGTEFFRAVCEQDLEGIVAKLRDGAYGEGWYKTRHPHYLQYEGRHELFEKRQATGA